MFICVTSSMRKIIQQISILIKWSICVCVCRWWAGKSIVRRNRKIWFQMDENITCVSMHLAQNLDSFIRFSVIRQFCFRFFNFTGNFMPAVKAIKIVSHRPILLILPNVSKFGDLVGNVEINQQIYNFLWHVLKIVLIIWDYKTSAILKNSSSCSDICIAKK